MEAFREAFRKIMEAFREGFRKIMEALGKHFILIKITTGPYIRNKITSESLSKNASI